MSTLLAGPTGAGASAVSALAADPAAAGTSAASRAHARTPAAGPAAAPARRGRLHRAGGAAWLARGLIAAGVVMIPWLFALAAQLPATTRAWHWSAAWAGLDGLEALGLLATGALLARRDSRHRLAAMATATLLVTDAWLDVMTAAPGRSELIAVAMAICPELPVAVLCATLALRRADPPASIKRTNARAFRSRLLEPPEVAREHRSDRGWAPDDLLSSRRPRRGSRPSCDRTPVRLLGPLRAKK